MPDNNPESQTVRDCAKLRQECQRALFAHIDEKHDAQMTELGEIKEKLAFQAGQANGARNCGTALNAPIKRDWSGMILKALFTWAPGIALLVVLGLISWLKSKGWL